MHRTENTSWDDAVTHCKNRGRSLWNTNDPGVWLSLYNSMLELLNTVDIIFIGLRKSTQNGEVRFVLKDTHLYTGDLGISLNILINILVVWSSIIQVELDPLKHI